MAWADFFGYAEYKNKVAELLDTCPHPFTTRQPPIGLRLSDPIEFDRDGYQHWCINLGDEMVHMRKDGQVVREPFRIVCGSSSYRINLDALEVAARERGLVQRGGRNWRTTACSKALELSEERTWGNFSLRFRNCEHFVTFCLFMDPNDPDDTNYAGFSLQSGILNDYATIGLAAEFGNMLSNIQW